MMQDAFFCTVGELSAMGRENIPPQFISGAHLIYSSPATLAFNSPGAEGFGVKRAGLAIPDSIMLIVAPGCCGRNTSLISSMREYDQRFFYLMMDETDIVTGRHLKKIPKAVKEICDSLEKKPSVVMICITCVDALAISIINAAVYMEKEAGRITTLAIAVGSAGPTALRAFHAEELLRAWKRPDSEEKWQSLHEEIAIALSEDISPIDDIRATGSYRKTVAANVVLQLVRELWEACEK